MTYRWIARIVVIVSFGMLGLWDIITFAMGHPEDTVCAAFWDFNMVTHWLFGLIVIAVFLHSMVFPYFWKRLYPPHEYQTCARRCELGPNHMEEHKDTWNRKHWDHKYRWAGTKSWTDEKGKRRQEKIGPKRQGWKHPWLPRACSYCGSIHPDDAIKLIEEGWEVEGSTKSYKHYLNPPGDRLRYEVLVGKRSIESLTPEEQTIIKNYWSPTPPVKLYMLHLTKDHVHRLNAAVEKARAAKETPT